MQRVRGTYFPESDVDGVRRFFDLGAYQPAERDAVLAMCRHFRRVVEIGAHIGLHTRHFAAAFAAVEAFEPHPGIHRCLEANVAGLGVSTHAAAASNRSGSAFIAARTGKDSGALTLESERKPGLDPCPVIKIDDYGWDDVDLIRVAVDRRPDQILAGALQTIERSRPVLWLVAAALDDAEVSLALRRLGYRVTATLPSGVVFAVSMAGGAQWATDHLVTADAELGDRLLRISSGTAARGVTQSAVAIDGAILPVETIGFHINAGRGELLAVALPSPGLPKEGVRFQHRGSETRVIPSTTTLDAVLAATRLTFVQGEFRLSLPPAALAYFREVVIALAGSRGEQVVARRPLLCVSNLDEIRIRPPLRCVDRTISSISVRLRTPDGQDRVLKMPGAFDPAEFSGDMVTCYLNRGGGGNPVVRAFAASMEARLAYAEDGARDGVALVWGVLRGSKELIDAVATRDGYYYYIDHAYFARGHLKNYRVTRNGFEAGPVRHCPTDRLEKLGIDLKPWRSGGGYILVCPPTDYFMQAHDCRNWLEDTLSVLRAQTDRKIVVRLKPQPGETVTRLSEAMAGAHALVAHSSNVAVEAVVAGTPVFVAPSSAAAPVGQTDLTLIETPVRPDRMAWLAHLSYSQFSFEEISDGQAWQMLRDFETRPFVKHA